MSDLPRKNCWAIAEHAGDATPGKMQHLLGGARWDALAVMDAVGGQVTQRLEGGDAVAILDESGQCKKGTATAGVKRQYVGCAGRVENAINVVYCSYASEAGHALVGARLYLPAEWADDPTRRRAAGIPEDADFATKPELGRRLPAGLHAKGRLPPWVTAAEVKRLLNLTTRTWHNLQHHLRRHIWRRRHQARARWHHQRTRLTRP